MLIELENSKFKATVRLRMISDDKDIDYKVEAIEFTGEAYDDNALVQPEDITEVLRAELERREMM